jgi:hypothetical protein
VIVEQPPQTSVLERIQQWELAGGKVRMQRASHSRVVVELCTCTGELMERLSSSDPAVLDDLRSRVEPLA